MHRVRRIQLGPCARERGQLVQIQDWAYQQYSVSLVDVFRREITIISILFGGVRSWVVDRSELKCRGVQLTCVWMGQRLFLQFQNGRFQHARYIKIKIRFTAND